MRCRVVCTFDETIASFSPIRALSKVLFPALGFPNMFTKPDFISRGDSFPTQRTKYTKKIYADVLRHGTAKASSKALLLALGVLNMSQNVILLPAKLEPQWSPNKGAKYTKSILCIESKVSQSPASKKRERSDFFPSEMSIRRAAIKR